MQLRRLLPNSRGDTIVEVLFAMVVISSVLTGAFFTSQRSTALTQTAQEHSEALQLAQGQLESLKAIADSDGTDQSADPVNIFDTNGPLPQLPNDFCVSPSDITIHDVNDPANYCSVDRNGATGHPENLQYKLDVTRMTDPNIPQDPSNPIAFLFTATVKWDSLVTQSNGGQNQVSMTYRLYADGNVTITRPPPPGKDNGNGGRVGCQKKPCKIPLDLVWKRSFWITDQEIVTANVVSCTWTAYNGDTTTAVVKTATWSPASQCLPHTVTNKVFAVTWPSSPAVCKKVTITLTFNLTGGKTYKAPNIVTTTPYGQPAPQLNPKGMCKTHG